MGHVVDATTDRPNRYVGETITKESIKVWVTVQGTNERRELGPDEYTIAPDKILNVGENKFIITFVETGSQGICVLTGMQENPISWVLFLLEEINIHFIYKVNSVITTIPFIRGVQVPRRVCCSVDHVLTELLT